MRQTLFTAAAAFLAGGITIGAVFTQAQPAPPPDAPMAEPSPHHGMMGGGMMRWRHRLGQGMAFNPRDLALIYREPDRQLAPADVQKIAEGFLLWNGNHSWKVTDLAATPDGPIGFSLTTPEGSIVAKFTIDPHSGKIVRIG